MNVSNQIIEQLGYIFGELAKKYPANSEEKIMTDISFRAKQDSGELTALDDDDDEIASAIIEEWIEFSDNNFYEVVRETLKQYLYDHKNEFDNLAILHPFSFVLVDEDLETVSELYQVDDDSIVIEHEELMKGLDKDLNNFIDHLLKE